MMINESVVSMPFQIIQGNILHYRCDAIVNPTDEFFSGSGGLDEQVHLVAGPELYKECAALGRLEIGQAALTKAYRLGCRKIIHTVAPWWSGREVELELLRECYRSSLRLALDEGLTELAFPLIGSGTRAFPKETVLEIAAEEIRVFLSAHDDFRILLVVHDRSEFQPSRTLLQGLDRYRQTLRVEESCYETDASVPLPTPMVSAPTQPKDGERNDRMVFASRKPDLRKSRRVKLPLFSRPQAKAPEAAPAPCEMPELTFSTERIVMDESFSEMVMRKIDERGFKKDSECYVRANIDRRLFSKIRSDQSYHPKKTTAVALAVALELTLDDTKELLEKAGYSLSHSILFDVIVEYCILQKNYDIFQINELLFQYDQPLLGG